MTGQIDLKRSCHESYEDRHGRHDRSTEARERFREVAKKLLSGAKERGLKLLLENLSAMRLD